MPAIQQRLFPDPQPLVERFGREFFLGLPEVPGVYLMRDEDGAVLYVGKARNLRKRLCCYRVANPERMARRQLRLLRLVRAIDLQLCRDEAEALGLEARLLLELKPRFNRAGTWPAPPRFLVFEAGPERIELKPALEPGAADELSLGPMGGAVRGLRMALARLIWLAANPGRGCGDLPRGWSCWDWAGEVVFCGEYLPGVLGMIDRLKAAGDVQAASAALIEWVRTQRSGMNSRFDEAMIEADTELISEFMRGWARRRAKAGASIPWAGTGLLLDPRAE